MKTALMTAAAAIALPFAAQAETPMQPIPGVSDEETIIKSGVIEDFHRGQGDSLYVRDRENKWFRLGLTEGCLKNGYVGRRIVFDRSAADTRIDTFTTVHFVESGRMCGIDSIRRSVAPPQVDSKSPIPVD